MAIQVPRDFSAGVNCCCVGGKRHRMVWTSISSAAWPQFCRSKFFEQVPTRSQLCSVRFAPVHRRIPDPSTGGVSSSDGWAIGSAAKYTFPCYAQRNGAGATGGDRVDSRPTRPIGLTAAFLLFRLADDPRACAWAVSMAGAITYVGRACAGTKSPRLLHRPGCRPLRLLGIVVSLAVIIATRTYFGNQVFDEWGRGAFRSWVSFLLVGPSQSTSGSSSRRRRSSRKIKARGADDQKPLEGGLP